jgi:hypothetical protein
VSSTAASHDRGLRAQTSPGSGSSAFAWTELSDPKQNCHPACPGLPWDRSVAQWRDLLFLSAPNRCIRKNHFAVGRRRRMGAIPGDAPPNSASLRPASRSINALSASRMRALFSIRPVYSCATLMRSSSNAMVLRKGISPAPILASSVAGMRTQRLQTDVSSRLSRPAVGPERKRSGGTGLLLSRHKQSLVGSATLHVVIPPVPARRGTGA